MYDSLLHSAEATGSEFACEEISRTHQPSVGSNDLEKAIQLLETSLEDSPVLSQFYFLLGRSYCLSGQYERAIEPLTTFTLKRPENPLGYIELGFAIEQECLRAEQGQASSEQTTEFLAFCSRNQDRMKIQYVWKSANLSAQDFIGRADLELEQGRLNNALAWYARALTIDSDTGLVWEKIARIYESDDQYELAALAYEKAVESGVSASVKSLAQLYQSQARNQETVELLQAALTDFPDAADRRWWWQTLGDLLLQKQDWEGALESSRRADREYPDDPDILINLGTAMYEVEGTVDAVRDIFKQAISLDPDRGDGFYAIGRLYAREQSFQEADRWFGQALERDPSNLWWRLGWANALRDWGMTPKAVRFYQEILRQSPTFDIALVELAWTYRLSGDRDLAIQTIEEALDLMHPPKAWYYQRAGQIYEWGDESEKARRAYMSALALDADNRVAYQGLLRIGAAE